MEYEKDIIIYKVSGLKKILNKLYPFEYWDGWKFMVRGNKRYAFIVPPDGQELLLIKSVETEIYNDDKTNNKNINFIHKLNIDFAISYSVMEKTIRLLK